MQHPPVFNFAHDVPLDEIPPGQLPTPTSDPDRARLGEDFPSSSSSSSSDATSKSRHPGGCRLWASEIRQKFSKNKERTLDLFRDFFYNLGGHIFDHPVWYISFSLIVACICALSFLFIHFETRADLLYALPASRARSDLAKQTVLFGRPPRVNMVFVVSADNSSVLTAPVLKKLSRLDQFIKHDLRSPERVPFDSTSKSSRRVSRPAAPVSYSYEEICYRMQLPDVDFSGVKPAPVEGEPGAEVDTGASAKQADCYSMSALDLYRNERQYGTPLATRQWPYIPNIVGNKIVKADLTLTDPSIVRLASGTTRLYNATGFLLLYHTKSAPNSALAQSLEWEGALIDFINREIKPHASDSGSARPEKLGKKYSATRNPEMPEFPDHEWKDFKVFVNAARSWQDELARATSLDLRLIRDYLTSFAIIATYMVLSNRTNNLVRSKSICGFIGALSAALGYVFGGGICYWLGLRHTPTMHASPFLVVAIGLDNTFVVLNFYTLAFTYVKNPRERCRMALRDSGISLTITTFTSIISFLVGAAGPYLAVRNFCLVTALGLSGGFIANIIFFFPFLCLESVAESEGRILFLPFVPLWVYKALPKAWRTDDTDVWLQDKLCSRDRQHAAMVTGLHSTFSTRPTGASSNLEGNVTNLTMMASKNGGEGSAGRQLDPFGNQRSFRSNREIELVSNLHHATDASLGGNPRWNNWNNENPFSFTHPGNATRVCPGQDEVTPSTSPRSARLRNGLRRILEVGGVGFPATGRSSAQEAMDVEGSDSDDFSDDSSFPDERSDFRAAVSGSLETVVDSTECLRTRRRRRKRANADSLSQKRDFLAQTLLTGRSLFEVASIQWRFRKRRKELGQEIVRRGMKLPKTPYWTDGRFGSDARSFIQNEAVNLTESDPKSVPDSVIKPLYKSCDLIVKMSDEPPGNNGKCSRGFFLKTLGPLWSKKWLQVSLMVLLVAYLVTSLYGAMTRLTAGLDLENLTPPDSYLREAFAMSKDKFPIFPYETSIVLTAPNLTMLMNDSQTPDWEKRSLIDTFASDAYGTRRASDLKPLSDNDLDAHTGSGGEAGSDAKMAKYLGTLGEIPWWEPQALEGMLELDKRLRKLNATQDVLNGLLLFFAESGPRIFPPESTSEERRKLFHQHLYRYLSTGVVGRHVRNQFLFGDPAPNDPQKLPRLLGYRVVLFNYNFLNSFAQSQYMTAVRELADQLSMEWSSTIQMRRVAKDDEEEAKLVREINNLLLYPTRQEANEGSRELEEEAAAEDEGLQMIKRQGSWFSAKPFMETFLFFESDVTILKATIVNMSTAFIAIIIASSLLMRGVSTALLVTFIICAVDLGIFGAMGFWNIHLNILSMILLVLSIGFSVDYSVHVVHTFAHAVGSTRIDKTVETLILMCNPVTHGAISTSLGILPIYFRREFIMETFFKMTLLVVAFGFLNGVVFLPIILAIKGPIVDTVEAKSRELRAHVEEVVRPLLLAAKLSGGDDDKSARATSSLILESKTR